MVGRLEGEKVRRSFQGILSFLLFFGFLGFWICQGNVLDFSPVKCFGFVRDFFYIFDKSGMPERGPSGHKT